MCLNEAAATGAIGDEPAVADRGDFRVEEGTNNEVGAELDIEGGGSGVNNGPNAYNHSREFCVGVFYQFAKDFLSEIAAVGELKGTDATIVAGLEHLLGNIDILVVEDGNYSCLLHGRNDLNLIVLCHNLYLDTRPLASPFIKFSTSATLT